MRVPSDISEKAIELCEKVLPGVRPAFIEITPEPGCEPADCFLNVQRKVEQQGGRVQCGWALWEWPGVLIEAEHHAVYEPPNGPPWIDLTPCERNSKRRLFLPDNNATYDFRNEGVRRSNIRLALSDDPLIGELFKAAEKREAFYNDLPGIGMISIHASEDKELKKLERRLSRATTALREKYGNE